MADNDYSRPAGYGARRGGEARYGRWPDRENWQTDDLGYAPRGSRYPMDYGFVGYPFIGGRYATYQTVPPFEPDYRERYPYEERRRGSGDRDFWDKAGDEVASWFGDDDAARRRDMDEHRGKGPKGYRRSDDRINEDVHDRLSDHPRLDASDITVTVKDSEVTLDGLVNERADKRRAEDCADSVSGVTHVQNNIRVRPQAESRS
ncbi:BON domain-containing protein [Rhizobium sp. L1K21]|uniref:BON domain-containing protein n=1 Tax=Rhizobium sp. L1K21 TaxID=2954933 RepID=UPI0020936FE2|nr:BON domain-containing protein [Rhizobium sp. L1K21]MCO6187803.1 BON domain-containing protein [Rhizobium sp. L1K21]